MDELRSAPAIAPTRASNIRTTALDCLGPRDRGDHARSPIVAGSNARSWRPRACARPSPTPLVKGAVFARGHTLPPSGGRAPCRSRRQSGQRDRAGRGLRLIPQPTSRVFAQLAPNAKRAACFRRQPPRDDPHALAQSAHELEGYYRLGIAGAAQSPAGTGFGISSGAFQGYISRTCVIPACELSITILTSAADGWPGFWLDGAMHPAVATRGAPSGASATGPGAGGGRSVRSIWCRSETWCWPPLRSCSIRCWMPPRSTSPGAIVGG